MPSFFLMIRRPPTSTLFPYTTLSRPLIRGRGEVDIHLLCPRQWRSSLERRNCTDRRCTRLNSSHIQFSYAVFFFNDPATTDIYSLSLHDALPTSNSGTPRSRYSSPLPKTMEECT